MHPDTIVIPWRHGEFSVQKQGAMCAPVNFKLGDGRTVQPFAIATWEDDGSTAFENLPPLLKRLRGEWPCVPFGMPEARADLEPEWAPKSKTSSMFGDWFHGPGSNLRWGEIARQENSVTLEVDYPPEHPISRLVRKVSGSSVAPRLDFELEIHPRHDCALPIGVHPIFKLPDKPGRAVLAFEGETQVHTYPVKLEPGVSKLPIGKTFSSLQSAQWENGSAVDLSRHPLPVNTEELVLVSGVSGRATLKNLEENYRVAIEWDPQAFSSCAVWISNCGRDYYPWNGGFRGIGIEMVTAPFDLGVGVANTNTTPLYAAGIPCTVGFKAGHVWKTGYSIEVVSI